MTVDKTDEEGRRWHNFWNSTDEEIPPRACIWAAGKRFGGKGWSERNLPKEGNPSWDELQKQVGYGNQMLVARKPYTRFGWFIWNRAGFYFNGPTPVPPKSWGRCTQDFPTVARIRSTVKRGSGLATLGETGLYFRPSKDSWDLVNAYDGQGPYAWGWQIGWGWGGWGLGGRWSYGQPPVFWLVDLIEGFDKSEGLAWVSLGEPPPGPKGFQVLVYQQDIADGNNDVSLQPVAYGDSFSSVIINGDVKMYEDGWLCFTTPGLYQFDIQLGLSGSTDGPADGGENPYSQIEITFDSETPGDLVKAHLTYSTAKVTLAPPVLKQGEYGVETTYITQYEEARLLASLIVTEPDDYDPMDADPDVLFRMRLNVYRMTNHPDGMLVKVGGNGTANNQGVNPETSQGSDAANVNP